MSDIKENNRISSDSRCPNCGNIIDDATRFCPFCGYDLSSKEAVKEEAGNSYKVFAYIIIALSLIAILFAVIKLL